METCKARICICNPHLESYIKWNDFKRCDKKVFKENLCRKCFEDDKRIWAAKYPAPRWKRDGIYGQPYDFPYHVLEKDKKWDSLRHIQIIISIEKEFDITVKTSDVGQLTSFVKIRKYIINS